MDGDVPLAINFAHLKLCAKPLEHPFGVIAGWHRLYDGGCAGCVERGQHHCTFYLSASDGQAIGNRHGRQASSQHQGQGAFWRCLDPSAHLLQRINDTLHRPARKARIACECRGYAMACDKPHEQPCAGSRIAHVERCIRLQ